MLLQVVKTVVLLWSLYFGYTVTWRFLWPPTDWSEFKGNGDPTNNTDEWAVVTGSSYGIGEQFAMSLAKRGINVVLCARTKSKLEALQSKISSAYPTVKTRVLPIDVTKDSWEAALDEVSDLKVSIIINNVGGGNVDGTLRLFHEFSHDHHEQVLRLNIYSAMKMISKFLPGMVQRRRGRVINVSSLAVYFGYKLSVYGPTKAFLNTWTEQLNTEYELYGIRFECLLVGEVSTPGIGNKPPDGVKVCSPEDITENALDRWGWYEVYAPFWGHGLLVWSTRLLIPTSLQKIILRHLMDKELSSDLAAGHKLIQEIHKQSTSSPPLPPPPTVEGKKKDL